MEETPRKLVMSMTASPNNCQCVWPKLRRAVYYPCACMVFVHIPLDRRRVEWVLSLYLPSRLLCGYCSCREPDIWPGAVQPQCPGFPRHGHRGDQPQTKEEDQYRDQHPSGLRKELFGGEAITFLHLTRWSSPMINMTDLKITNQTLVRISDMNNGRFRNILLYLT